MKAFIFCFSSILFFPPVHASELLDEDVEKIIEKIEPLTVELRWSFFKKNGADGDDCPKLMVGRDAFSEQYVFDRVALNERLRLNVSYFINDEKGQQTGRSFITQMGGSHDSAPEILTVDKNSPLSFEVCDFPNWFISTLRGEFLRTGVNPEDIKRLELEFAVRDFLLPKKSGNENSSRKITLLAKPITLDRSQIIMLLKNDG